LILARPAAPFHQVPTILKSSVDRSQIRHVGEDEPGVGGGIEVIQGVPPVLAVGDGLSEIHVVKGVGARMATSVTLPAPSGGHGLTPESNLSMIFGGEKH